MVRCATSKGSLTGSPGSSDNPVLRPSKASPTPTRLFRSLSNVSTSGGIPALSGRPSRRPRLARARGPNRHRRPKKGPSLRVCSASPAAPSSPAISCSMFSRLNSVASSATMRRCDTNTPTEACPSRRSVRTSDTTDTHSGFESTKHPQTTLLSCGANSSSHRPSNPLSCTARATAGIRPVGSRYDLGSSRIHQPQKRESGRVGLHQRLVGLRSRRII